MLSTKNKSINIWLLVGSLFILIIGIIIAISILQPSPQKTVKKYFNYIGKEDYKNAYSLLSGNYQKSKGSLEEFTAIFVNARNHGTVYGEARINRVRSTSRKSQKIVAFTLTTREKGKPSQATGQYILIYDKETKNWKIADSIE